MKAFVNRIINKISHYAETKPNMTAQVCALLNAMVSSFNFYSAKKIESLSGSNLVYFRGIVAMIFGYTYLTQFQTEIPVFPISKIAKKVILIRMIVSGCAITMRITAVKMNPLQEFIVILRTEVVQTMIIGILFLGKKFTVLKLVSCCLS